MFRRFAVYKNYNNYNNIPKHMTLKDLRTIFTAEEIVELYGMQTSPDIENSFSKSAFEIKRSVEKHAMNKDKLRLKQYLTRLTPQEKEEILKKCNEDVKHFVMLLEAEL